MSRTMNMMMCPSFLCSTLGSDTSTFGSVLRGIAMFLLVFTFFIGIFLVYYFYATNFQFSFTSFWPPDILLEFFPETDAEKNRNSNLSCENSKDHMEHRSMLKENELENVILVENRLERQEKIIIPKEPEDSQELKNELCKKLSIVPEDPSSSSPSISSSQFSINFDEWLEQSTSSTLDIENWKENGNFERINSDDVNIEEGDRNVNFMRSSEPASPCSHYSKRPSNFPTPLQLLYSPCSLENLEFLNKVLRLEDGLEGDETTRRIVAQQLRFARKTPEFVPRMMTDEFHSIDKSIEKRKLDIGELLRRVENAKHQYRTFSQHLHSAQTITADSY